MGTGRATSRDWDQYYARAERRRLTGEVVDPFPEHLARITSRERRLMVLSGLCMAALVVGFYAMLIR